MRLEGFEPSTGGSGIRSAAATPLPRLLVMLSYEKGTTRIELVTCGSAIRCSTAELSTRKLIAPPPGLEPGTYRLTAERSAN